MPCSFKLAEVIAKVAVYGYHQVFVDERAEAQCPLKMNATVIVS